MNWENKKPNITGKYRAYEAVSFDQSNNKFSKADEQIQGISGRSKDSIFPN
jgi:hypothetical protein